MILVFNSGSSSLKFGCFEADLSPSVNGEVDWADGNRAAARLTLWGAEGTRIMQEKVCVKDDLSVAQCAIAAIRRACPAEPVAVGHRVVHGGEAFQETTLITPAVSSAVGRLGRLAPLHNPPALRTIEAASVVLSGVPQVAVFDTSFYRHLPKESRVYALPLEWHERYEFRRYGFHGLSHQYCAGQAAQLLGKPLEDLRIVSCHLGGGCSATAIQQGRAVASTMGFSPLDGLIMGTRCGSMDPGLLLYLQMECGLTTAEIDTALNRRSGLLGLSGLSQDYAELERAVAGNEHAKLAIDVFDNAVRSAIAGLAARMNGVDAVLFTDRIGERSAGMRARVCRRLQFMGVRLDPELNEHCLPDRDIASPDSQVRVLVVHTREELMVARETLRIIQ